MKTERLTGKAFQKRLISNRCSPGKGIMCENGCFTDISSQGLGPIAPNEMTEGEILKLLISFKSIDVSVPVFAEVRWAQPFERDYKAGLRFLG